MAEERTLDTAELRAAMETTRASLGETVHQLKGRVSETMNWRTYLDRYAGVTLVGAAVAGALVGRAVGSRMGRGGEPEVQPTGGYLVSPSGRTALASSGSLTLVRSSWSRAGSRLEGLINRAIDELADLMEQRALPAMMTRLRTALGLEPGPGEGPSEFTYHGANR